MLRGEPEGPFNSRCQIAAAADGRDGNSFFRDRADLHLAGMLGGGARRDRTDDLMLAKHALYQLSYGPSSKRPASWERPSQGRHRSSSVRPRVTQCVVGPGGLEPPTSRLSGVCSNQLSYRP